MIKLVCREKVLFRIETILRIDPLRKQLMEDDLVRTVYRSISHFLTTKYR